MDTLNIVACKLIKNLPTTIILIVPGEFQSMVYKFPLRYQDIRHMIPIGKSIKLDHQDHVIILIEIDGVLTHKATLDIKTGINSVRPQQYKIPIKSHSYISESVINNDVSGGEFINIFFERSNKAPLTSMIGILVTPVRPVYNFRVKIIMDEDNYERDVNKVSELRFGVSWIVSPVEGRTMVDEIGNKVIIKKNQQDSNLVGVPLDGRIISITHPKVNEIILKIYNGYYASPQKKEWNVHAKILGRTQYLIDDIDAGEPTNDDRFSYLYRIIGDFKLEWCIKVGSFLYRDNNIGELIGFGVVEIYLPFALQRSINLSENLPTYVQQHDPIAEMIVLDKNI